MQVRNRRLAIAGVITAAAIAVPPAAFAAASGSPSGKPSSPPACATSACKSKASHAAAGKSAAKSTEGSALAALAASAGISTDRLQAGLGAAKRAGGNTAAGIAAFAASAGVSQATAQRIVHAVFGTQVEGKTGGQAAGVPSMAPALARQLGISTSAAQHALDQLAELSRGGIVQSGPAFAAIAHDLGVSPARLAAALTAAKQSLAGK